jgi:small subunit ribosomal protein S18
LAGWQIAVAFFVLSSDLLQNFSFISEYMTAFGRIKGAEKTGLRPVNQRKVAKAIRRAIGLGIHPSVHQHPEILMRKGMLSRGQSTPGAKY